MSTKPAMPKFKGESEEAEWWASSAGRAYVKGKSAAARLNKTKVTGSKLVAERRPTA